MKHMRDTHIRRVQSHYDQYREWIRDTLETEDQPSIRLAAMFVGKVER